MPGVRLPLVSTPPAAWGHDTRGQRLATFTRGVFDLVDADGSGEISVEEYTEIMSAFGVAEGIPEWSFKHLDLNGDGKISKDEFVTIVEQFHLSQDRDAPGNFLFGPY